MKTYCFDCDNTVEYRAEIQTVEIDVRGIKFCYNEKIAYCKKCGNEIYSPIINDLNCEAREIAYANAKRRQKWK